MKRTSPVLALALLFGALTAFAQDSVEAYHLSLLAGRPAAPMITDGLGADARFQSITAMWGDSTSLYVSDATAIRRIDLSSTNVTTISQTASSGLQRRPLSGIYGYLVSFNYGGLYGLWGNSSYLYSTDIGAGSLRQINLTTGGVQTITTSPALPWGLASDGTNLYVANAGSGTITRIDPVTGANSQFASTGRGTGPTCTGSPSGCANYFVPGPRSAWSDTQSLYVSGYSGTLMKIDLASGTQSFLPAVPFFIGAISGLPDRVFVAAASGSQLGSVDRATGVFTAIAGLPSTLSISALWSDGAGLYVAVGSDLSGQAVERIDLATGNITLVAGYVPIREFTDGVGGAARFQNPEGVWGDGQNLYVADTVNFTIRKVALSTGAVTTFAGQPTVSTILDGVGTAAAFKEPRNVWGDGAHLYVVDSSSIRSIDLVTAQVTTLAGSTVLGAVDGPGATALFNRPFGLWGNNGILYVADYGNGVIRQMDLTSNQVTTLAGGYGIGAQTDGIGLNARFIGPEVLWGDGTTLYVGSRQSIRTITLNTAEVRTLTALPFYLSQALWGNGRKLYVLNSEDNPGTRIHLYDVNADTGVVTEPVHDNSDIEAGLPFMFPGGWGIWSDGANLFITDYSNNTIRELTPASPPALTRQQITIPGFSSNTTRGTATALSVGYAEPAVESGNATLSGFAIFSLRQDGVLVSEASVPALPAILLGRVTSSTSGVVRTGIAIANPNPASATISYYFTDASGNNGGQGTFTLAGGAQIARFLTEDPFNGPSRPNGTFTFVSSIPVSALALRGYFNERSEFLMSTLPVIDLSHPASGPLTVTHFAAGGGWITELLLINPSDQPISGTVQTVGGNAPFQYAIPARSEQSFDFGGATGTVTTGAFQVLPDNATSPGAVAIFSFVENGIRVSEASVPDVPAATAFHLYAEVPAGAIGSVGSTRSGFAITNTSAVAQDVKVDLTNATGGMSYDETGRRRAPQSMLQPSLMSPCFSTRFRRSSLPSHGLPLAESTL